jgi:N-acetylglucosaminyldiphosphoundecaprenol N-acetyl-beta-D-mannosaminyltransferase
MATPCNAVGGSFAPEEADRLNVLGVGVSATNLDLACAMIDRWIDSGARRFVTVTGVHGVMESQRDPVVRAIHNRAGMVTPDGMPLVWLLRLAGYRRADRVYGPDLMDCLLDRTTSGYRHFFYGTTSATLSKLIDNVARNYPCAVIAGHYAPPFRQLSVEEDAMVVDMIDQSRPDILWIGLSTPKQELWMGRHVGRIQVPVMIGVGAAFDFHAGTVRQAPWVIQRSGLEWLFRMAMEPRRLAGRYLRNNPAFIAGVLCQKLGLKSYSLD